MTAAIPYRFADDEDTQELARDVIVRAAVVPDYFAVSEIVVRAYAEHRRHMSPLAFAHYLDNIADVGLHAGDGQVLVAEQAGRVVGTATFYANAADLGMGLPADWAAVRALAVDPQARGRGIGAELIYDCIARARALGLTAIGLHTAAFMTRAIRLYERIGFRRQPAYDTYPHAPTAKDAVKALAYRLTIHA